MVANNWIFDRDALKYGREIFAFFKCKLHKNTEFVICLQRSDRSIFVVHSVLSDIDLLGN